MFLHGGFHARPYPADSTGVLKFSDCNLLFINLLFFADTKYFQIGVFPNHRRELAEAYFSAAQQRPEGFAVIMVMQNLQPIHGKTYIGALLYYFQMVRANSVSNVGDGVAALGSHVKAIAFPQIAGVERPFIWFLPPKIGDMEGIDIPMMIQRIFSCTSL